jgi:hypothetical protein
MVVAMVKPNGWGLNSARNLLMSLAPVFFNTIPNPAHQKLNDTEQTCVEINALPHSSYYMYHLL